MRFETIYGNIPEIKMYLRYIVQSTLTFCIHTFTCTILCVNKQAKYNTHNYKIKSVNQIVHKNLKVPGKQNPL